MAATPLQPPAANFGTLRLPIRNVDPAKLTRISGYPANEPFFGYAAAHRFDDVNPVIGQRFGTCYLGSSLQVAFAESVLHNRVASNNGFSIKADDIKALYAHEFSGPALRLANMTNPMLLRLGGNAQLTGDPHYGLARQWSAAICAHPAQVDGFIYTSRQTGKDAIVLFQRPGAPAPSITHAPPALLLTHHIDFKSVCKKFGVRTT